MSLLTDIAKIIFEATVGAQIELLISIYDDNLIKKDDLPPERREALKVITKKYQTLLDDSEIDHWLDELC